MIRSSMKNDICETPEWQDTTLQQRVADIEHILATSDHQHNLLVYLQQLTLEMTQTNPDIDIDCHHQRRFDDMHRKPGDLLSTFLLMNDMPIACLDSTYTVLFVNQAYAMLYGREPSFFPGKNYFDLHACEQLRSIFRCVVDHGESVTEYARLYDQASQPEYAGTYWDWMLHPLKDGSSSVKGMLLCMLDVTERTHIEQIYRTLVNHAQQGMAVFQDQRMVLANPAMASITGYGVDELLAMAPDELNHLIHPEDQALVQTYHADRLEGQTLPPRYEYRCVRKDQEIRWIEVTIAAIHCYGKPALQATYVDITERKSVEQQLRQRVLHDDLTGLPNRTLFMEFLEHAIKRAKRDADHQFALLFLDLNNFKVINDSLGHLAGDQMLITIAGRLKTRVRASDTVARFGGDEFVILLEDFNTVLEVIVLTHRIQRDIALPIYLNNHEVLPSASIGIALGASDYDHPADILRDADTAMYSARSLGPGRYAVFDATMHTQVMQRLNIEGALRRAIEHGELCLYYQPIVSLSTGKLIGFEALVRWQHPQRGLLSPSEFIPIAEETGLIIPLNWWVIRAACTQIRVWQEKFPAFQDITVSINLSAQAFMHHSVVDQIGQVLQEIELDPARLKIEITESTMMDHAETTIATLKRLCDLGLNLCIDDFGTGFSSLRYLHRFPITILKIDRSFIGNMHVDAESTAIIQSIITLSHTLGKKVIAEGIETPEQLRYLLNSRCEYGQGFLFSRPVNISTAEMLMLQGGYGIASFLTS